MFWKRNKATVNLGSVVEQTESIDSVRKLSKKELQAMVGGVTRAEYCGTLLMTYDNSSLEKANAEYSIYKAAWDKNCAAYY